MLPRYVANIFNLGLPTTDDTSLASFWEDSRLIPLYGAGLSALHLAGHAMCAKFTHDVSKTMPGLDPERPRPRQNVLRCLIERAGGSAMVAPKLTRVICSFLLVGLSIVTLLQRQAIPYTGTSLPWVQYVEPGVYVHLFSSVLRQERNG